MHKKTLTLALLAASVAAVATTVPPAVRKAAPAVETSSAPAVKAKPAVTQSPPAYIASPDVSQALARWNSLRQADNLPFSSYASFLSRHRGWPGEDSLRRTAERQINPDSTPPHEVISYFRAQPALTTTGHARHAFALLASGQVDQAREAARKAWHGGVLPKNDEDRLLAYFGGALTPEDHDRRMETLLANSDTVSAGRTIGYASARMRPIYEARLALQTQASDAEARLAAIGSAAQSNPGVIRDRAEWMRNSGNSLASRALLARSRNLSSHPHDPEKWFETLLQVARAAANDNQWSMAYQIASQIDDAYPAGTDVSKKGYGERDDYTSLAWLAGTSAQKLGRHADAVGMFERYGRAAQSPQTQAKGLYWAGRAAQASGQQERAKSYYAEAGRNFDQYYGQLALERLGRPLPPPPAPDLAQPSQAERQAFYNRDLVAAARLLGQMGSWRDQTDFVRAISADVESDAERLLAVQLAQEMGRPDLGVMVARRARTDGSTDYKRWGFPEMRVPSGHQNNWVMIHAITRQESQFDREAVSHAGARGLMQLMPATARETAGKIGLGYEMSRLTRDTDYNIMLGSTYFSRMLDYWDGSIPLAVASYNAGPGNVRKWVRANGDPRTPGVDMVQWIEDIPIFETRNYVQRVLENAVVYDLLHPSRARTPAQNRLSYYLGKNQPG